MSSSGCVPAIAVRELSLRGGAVRRGAWTWVVATCVPLAFSAFYEMLEWWAALVGGESAESFLGTQGDVWDTQWDMFLALVGATAAVLTLSRVHDRSLLTLLGRGGSE